MPLARLSASQSQTPRQGSDWIEKEVKEKLSFTQNNKKHPFYQGQRGPLENLRLKIKLKIYFLDTDTRLHSTSKTPRDAQTFWNEQKQGQVKAKAQERQRSAMPKKSLNKPRGGRRN